MRLHRWRYAVTMTLFLAFLAGCTSTESDPLPTLASLPTQADITQSPDSPGEVVETQGFVTEEVMPLSTQTEIPVETEEIFATAESVRYQNDEGDLFIVVTGLLGKEQIPTLPDARAGERFVVLNTTIANLTGTPLKIEGDSLHLIDQQFNRYEAIAPDDFFRTPLVSMTTNGDGTVPGVIRFSIPEDAIPYLLEWCPGSDCEAETLQTFLP